MNNKIKEILDYVINNNCLKKIVLSKPIDKNIIKTEAIIFKKSDEKQIQFANHMKDNKVLHNNFNVLYGLKELENIIENQYKQCNIITVLGDCEIKINKKGDKYINNKIDMGKQEIYEITQHNKQKNYIIPSDAEFLYHLGISQHNGKIIDKKQNKYKQINKFLELVDNISDKFNKNNVINIVDLCCGKSYLTFGVHYYFTKILNKKVNIIGIDLKQDIIDYCNNIAQKMNLSDIRFINEDIIKYCPENEIDLVISLHACDIATDIVLYGAIKSKAKVIFSSPCCHHEISTQLSCENLNFISDYGILNQRLSEITTDALRGEILEIYNYKVDIVEFINLEHTPKNLMIRAVKNKSNMLDDKKQKMILEYNNICNFLNINPKIKQLLEI